MSFVAGYNMPGYLPDSEDAAQTFDTFSEAVNFLAATVDSFWDADYDFDGDYITNGERVDAIWLDIHTSLHNAGNGNSFSEYAGGYSFWINPSTD